MNNESSRKPVFDIELIDNFFTKLLKDIPDIYYIKIEIGDDKHDESVEKIFRGALVSSPLDEPILNDKVVMSSLKKTCDEINQQNDFYCELCGRGLDELEPFDDSVFRGAKLAEHFRRIRSESQVDAVWECRDCYFLSDEEYFRKWNERNHQDRSGGVKEPR